VNPPFASSFEVYLLGPGEVKSIGPETGKRPKNGIGRYRCIYGSVRYVLYVNGNPVSALQCVSDGSGEAFVANVFTLPAHRRMGHARRLLKRARRDFQVVKHSPNRACSYQGIRWKRAVG
jgi:GNAT superfamily N-acetyltransferase